MEVNVFHILGRHIVDELTTDERRTIDAISKRLSDNPEFEAKLRADFIQGHIDRTEAAQKDAQLYADETKNCFAK